MFDTIFVAQNLIEDLIKDTDLTLEYFEGYYNFQTKDLDNCLLDFYIEKDGSFKWQKHEYGVIEPDHTKGNPWYNNGLEHTGKSELLDDTRTAYFNFYDFFITDTERVSITFTAHIKNGKLAEPLVINKIERVNLKDEQKANEKIKEQWTKTQSTWEWQVATLIFEARWKIKKVFLPLFNFFDNLENTLRDRARDKYKTNV